MGAWWASRGQTLTWFPSTSASPGGAFRSTTGAPSSPTTRPPWARHTASSTASSGFFCQGSASIWRNGRACSCSRPPRGTPSTPCRSRGTPRRPRCASWGTASHRPSCPTPRRRPRRALEAPRPPGPTPGLRRRSAPCVCSVRPSPRRGPFHRRRRAYRSSVPPRTSRRPARGSSCPIGPGASRPFSGAYTTTSSTGPSSRWHPPGGSRSPPGSPRRPCRRASTFPGPPASSTPSSNAPTRSVDSDDELRVAEKCPECRGGAHYSRRKGRERAATLRTYSIVGPSHREVTTFTRVDIGVEWPKIYTHIRHREAWKVHSRLKSQLHVNCALCYMSRWHTSKILKPLSQVHTVVPRVWSGKCNGGLSRGNVSYVLTNTKNYVCILT